MSEPGRAHKCALGRCRSKGIDKTDVRKYSSGAGATSPAICVVVFLHYPLDRPRYAAWFNGTMFSDPNKYIMPSSEMQDEYLTSPTNEAYAHYVKPTKEEQQYLFDPPSVPWRSFPVWPSYYLFAEKRGPKDQYTKGLKLDLCGACWYWYYTGDLDDKSHQGLESKQGSPERTWVIYITRLYIVEVG